MMTRETILLLVRHALTAGGLLLTQMRVVTTDDVQQFTDAALVLVGSALTVAGLCWSFARKFKRERDVTVKIQNLGLAVLVASGLCGCSTVTVQDRETGFTLTRCSNAFAKSALGPFEVSIKQDGTRTLRLGAYAQESQDSWAGITSAFAAGFKGGMEAYQGRSQTPPQP